MRHWRHNYPLLKEWGWSIHTCNLLPRLDPYSYDDLPMTHHAHPDTGRMVKGYGKHYDSVGGLLPYLPISNACLQLADGVCPFIRRIDGEHKSKEQYFTEEWI